LTSFAELIEQSREGLLIRQDELRRELNEIEAEMAAIDAYERTKREMGSPASHKIGGTGRYPRPNDGTLSVPQAGREFLGLSESGSWLAARRGDIPAVKIGRYRRVPVDAMRRKLAERQAAAQ
jgi:hypothetical protein